MYQEAEVGAVRRHLCAQRRARPRAGAQNIPMNKLTMKDPAVVLPATQANRLSASLTSSLTHHIRSTSKSCSKIFFLIIFLIGEKLLYNVVLVSAVQ